MKKATGLLLVLILLLSLCACSGDIAPVAPDPTPSPTPTPEPADVAAWMERAQERYNMEYTGLAGYWSLMCDEFYGDDVNTILSVISFPEKDEEISQKRAQYADEYGEDWKYKITAIEKTQLDEKACSDFAEELEDICDKASVIVNASKDWSAQEWSDFASDLDCTTEQAKAVIEAYADIADICHEANVTQAYDIALTLRFTGSKTEALTTEETDCIYKVNGVYVSEMLLDCSYALINLVY